jgi:hypothetical protein
MMTLKNEVEKKNFVALMMADACNPILIPSLWLKQEDSKFKASLGYTVRPILKKKNNTVNSIT